MISKLQKVGKIMISKKYINNTEDINFLNALDEQFLIDRFMKSRAFFDCGILNIQHLQTKAGIKKVLSAAKDSIMKIIISFFNKVFNSVLSGTLNLIALAYYDKTNNVLAHPKKIMRTLFKIGMKTKDDDKRKTKLEYNGFDKLLDESQFSSEIIDAINCFNGINTVTISNIMEVYERATVRLIKHSYFDMQENILELSTNAGMMTSGINTYKKDNYNNNNNNNKSVTNINKNENSNSNDSNSIDGEKTQGNKDIFIEEIDIDNEDKEQELHPNPPKYLNEHVRNAELEKGARIKEQHFILQPHSPTLTQTQTQTTNFDSQDIDEEDEVMQYIRSPVFKRFRNMDLRSVCLFNPTKQTQTRYKSLVKFVLIECAANLAMKLRLGSVSYESESTFLLNGSVTKILFFLFIFTGSLSSKDIETAMKIQSVKINEFFYRKDRGTAQFADIDNIFIQKYGYLAQEYRNIQTTQATDIHRLLKSDVSKRFKKKLVEMNQVLRVHKNKINIKKDEMLASTIFFENFRYQNLKRKVTNNKNIYSNNIFVFCDKGYDALLDLFQLITTETKLVKLPCFIYAKGLIEKFINDKLNKSSCISTSLDGLNAKLKERKGLSLAASSNTAGSSNTTAGAAAGTTTTASSGGSGSGGGGSYSVTKDKQFNIIILDGISSDKEIEVLHKILLLSYNKKTELNLILCFSYSHSSFNFNDYSHYDDVLSFGQNYKYEDSALEHAKAFNPINVGLKLLNMQHMNKSSILRLGHPKNFTDALSIAILRFTYFFNTTKFQTFIGGRETRALLLAHALALLNPGLASCDKAFVWAYKTLAILTNSVADNGDGTSTTSNLYNNVSTVPSRMPSAKGGNRGTQKGNQQMNNNSEEGNKAGQNTNAKIMNLPGTYILINENKTLYSTEMTPAKRAALPPRVQKMSFRDIIEIVTSFQPASKMLPVLLEKCSYMNINLATPIQHLEDLFTNSILLSNSTTAINSTKSPSSTVANADNTFSTNSMNNEVSILGSTATGKSQVVGRTPTSPMVSSKKGEIEGINYTPVSQFVVLSQPSERLQRIVNIREDDMNQDYIDPIELYMIVKNRYNNMKGCDVPLVELQPFNFVSPIRPYCELRSHIRPLIDPTYKRTGCVNICAAHFSNHKLRPFKVEEIQFSPYALSYYTNLICYTYSSITKFNQRGTGIVTARKFNIIDGVKSDTHSGAFTTRLRPTSYIHNQLSAKIPSLPNSYRNQDNNAPNSNSNNNSNNNNHMLAIDKSKYHQSMNTYRNNNKAGQSESSESVRDTEKEKEKQEISAALVSSSYILVLSTTETSMSLYKVRCKALGAYALKIVVKEKEIARKARNSDSGVHQSPINNSLHKQQLISSGGRSVSVSPSPVSPTNMKESEGDTTDKFGVKPLSQSNMETSPTASSQPNNNNNNNNNNEGVTSPSQTALAKKNRFFIPPQNKEQERTYISFTDTPGDNEFYAYVSLMLKALDPTGEARQGAPNTENDYCLRLPVVGFPEISFFVSSSTDPFPKPLSFYDNRNIRIQILE